MDDKTIPSLVLPGEEAPQQAAAAVDVRRHQGQNLSGLSAHAGEGPRRGSEKTDFNRLVRPGRMDQHKYGQQQEYFFQAFFSFRRTAP